MNGRTFYTFFILNNQYRHELQSSLPQISKPIYHNPINFTKCINVHSLYPQSNPSIETNVYVWPTHVSNSLCAMDAISSPNNNRCWSPIVSTSNDEMTINNSPLFDTENIHIASSVRHVINHHRERLPIGLLAN